MTESHTSSLVDARCPQCGDDASDSHFDRSLCACGVMHTCCNGCGWPLDGCDYADLEGSLADGLDDE